MLRNRAGEIETNSFGNNQRTVNSTTKTEHSKCINNSLHGHCVYMARGLETLDSYHARLHEVIQSQKDD